MNTENYILEDLKRYLAQHTARAFIRDETEGYDLADVKVVSVDKHDREALVIIRFERTDGIAPERAFDIYEMACEQDTSKFYRLRHAVTFSEEKEDSKFIVLYFSIPTIGVTLNDVRAYYDAAEESMYEQLTDRE